MLRSLLALHHISGVGPATLRKLVETFHSPSEVFALPADEVAQSCSLTSLAAQSLADDRDLAFARADEQIRLAERYHVSIVPFTDTEAYPSRLAACPDAPPFIYVRGEANLRTTRTLAVVGTRRITPEAKELCHDIVTELCHRHPDLVIVSGLAFGTDITAHRAALAAGRATVAVLAHGLDRLYPVQHRDVASQMVASQGAVLSEFPFGTEPDRYNFITRNHVIAGLSDATLVIESGLKGGSLHTADFATSYSRPVLAVPGFPGREMSEGCNSLIKSGAAQLVESADDIDLALGWEHLAEAYKKAALQQPLFAMPLSADEQTIVDALRAEDGLSANVLVLRTALTIARVNSALLSLELNGLVRSIPGNAFKLVGQ